MTQPDHVPLLDSDRIRPSERLNIPLGWRQDRPADLVELTPPSGPRFGSVGPDAGYGLKLAKRFEADLVLGDGESAHDAVAGCFACGSRRAAAFGRAPVIYDMEWAYTLWGFLGDAPEDLLAWRRDRFRGASHDYWHGRQVVDAVAEPTLRLTPQQVRAQLGAWRQLLLTD